MYHGRHSWNKKCRVPSHQHQDHPTLRLRLRLHLRRHPHLHLIAHQSKNRHEATSSTTLRATKYLWQCNPLAKPLPFPTTGNKQTATRKQLESNRYRCLNWSRVTCKLDTIYNSSIYMSNSEGSSPHFIPDAEQSIWNLKTKKPQIIPNKTASSMSYHLRMI